MYMMTYCDVQIYPLLAPLEGEKSGYLTYTVQNTWQLFDRPFLFLRKVEKQFSE